MPGQFRIEFRRYRLPFRLAVRTAHGVWREREGLILRLAGENGVTGWGEVSPVEGFAGESVDEAEAVCAGWGGKVDLGQFAAVPKTLPCLRGALGAALAEIAPAAETAAAPRAVPEYLPVAALLPAGRPALAAIAAKADAGFRIFKWKVAVADPADELAMLDDLCAALPVGAKVRLDANGGWDRRWAERWLDRSADYPIDFIEQPIAPFARGAEDILLGLANDYPTPVALDESLSGAADIIRWLDSGWKGVFVVKPALLGDPAAALDRLAAAQAAVVFSSALETAVGARSGLQTAFRWPGPPRALGFGVWPLFADPRCDGPAATPFIRWQDVAAIDPEALWNVLS
jgi:O-succinylbenzoate synthase